jgi:two-component system sensor histidine kinase FlrB
LLTRVREWQSIARFRALPGVEDFMQPSGPESAARLDEAFSAFTEVSEQLAASYEALERRVEQLTQALASARDERVEQFAENGRLANRLAHLLSVLPAGVIVLDGNGIVQQHNPAAASLLGENLDGQTWVGVIARVFDPRPRDGHEISLRDGRLVSVATQSLSPEPGQIVLLTDMTGTRALQERVRQGERLAVMGEMAASLAHQIRTPLASALLYVSHLLRPDLDEATRLRTAEKIRERLRHLEHQINDMLVFARGGASVAARVTIDDLVGALQTLLEAPLQTSGCTLDVRHEAGAVEVLANRDALLGALVNLAVNGMQAAGRGGQLQLETQRAGADVLIRVRDNGPGIPAELRARIFEPFFSTRAQGTGLGLAVVRSVVEAHRGGIELESAPGRGCVFTVTLPQAPEAKGSE